MKGIIEMMRGENRVLSKYIFNKYYVSLIVACIAELLVYFTYINKLDFYTSSSFYTWLPVCLGIVLIATKLKPRLALQLSLLIIFLPFIFYPIITAIFFLILVIVFLSTEKTTDADCNFFIAIILLTIYAINKFETSPIMMLLPVSLLFVFFGKRKVITSACVVMIVTFLMLFVSYPNKEKTLVSRINHAPLYTINVEQESMKGYKALMAHYSNKDVNSVANFDPLFMDATTKVFKMSNVIVILFSGLIIALLSQLLEALEYQNIRIPYTAFITSIYVFITMYVLPFYVMKSMGMDVNMTKLGFRDFMLFSFSYVISYVFMIVKNYEPKDIEIDEFQETDTTYDTNEQLNSVAFSEDVQGKTSKVTTCNEKSVFEEENTLSHVCKDLYDLLKILCQESLKCVGMELYGDDWFTKVKSILNANPDVFHYPTSILDYRDMDITMTIRILTDRNYHIGKHVSKSRKLLKSLERARDARNDYNHNGSNKDSAYRKIAYNLVYANHEINRQLYDRFPNFFESKISESYTKVIQELDEKIETIR